jgi:hypothetical protein
MPTDTEGVDKLVEESGYVLKATVTRLNASNEPAVRPVPGLIVAHVDERHRRGSREFKGEDRLSRRRTLRRR